MPSAAAADWRIRLVLSTLMAFAAISTDLYLPALPTVAVALQADPARIQLTIATYLAGFTLGQLLWGPIGDRYGRRLPIAAGTMLFILGAVACTLAQSASQLLAGRIIQALGASAGVVLARAIVRDLYARDRAAQMLSRLMIVMLIAPMSGPTIGGQCLALAFIQMTVQEQAPLHGFLAARIIGRLVHGGSPVNRAGEPSPGSLRAHWNVPSPPYRSSCRVLQRFLAASALPPPEVERLPRYAEQLDGEHHAWLSGATRGHTVPRSARPGHPEPSPAGVT